MLDLDAIEDALVAALAADPTIHAYAGTVASFQGEIDRARASGVAIKYPILMVGYAGGPTRPFGGFRFAATLRWQVTVACQNLRSPGAARKAPTATEKGAYDVIRDVLRVLSGQTLGLEIGELKPTGVEPVESDSSSVAQYAVMFETEVEFDMAEADFRVPVADPPPGGETTTPQDVSDLATIHAAHAIRNEAGEDHEIVTDRHEVGA